MMSRESLRGNRRDKPSCHMRLTRPMKPSESVVGGVCALTWVKKGEDYSHHLTMAETTGGRKNRKMAL